MSPTEKVEVLVVTKISDAETKDLDKTKMGVTMVRPLPEQEVEGQAVVVRYVRCPCNGCLTWLYYDTERYHWYTCGVCGCQMWV
jgi:hypothetical protein